MNLEDALGGWPAGGNNQPQGGPWPGQPANPAWPGGQPGGGGAWPGQPNQPSQPGWPGQPTQPAQPSQPGWPGQPTQPAQPSQPGWPAQPNQPSQPAWPSPSPQPSAPGGWTNPSPGPVIGPGPGPGFGPGPTAPQKIVSVPYNDTLRNGVYDKLLITIVGTINPKADKVTVDLSSAQDLAFHFNPRFNEGGKKTIVRNSCISTKWGKEERDLSGSFPFTAGQPFEMKIMCTNTEFKVAVNNSHVLSYKHRVGNLNSINRLSIYNDLTLSDVRMETVA
uniref:galectin-3b n=1 Tax=Gasterosteus aculeatus aculeatus TaxID=481459 RepID=UPI0000E3C74C|nr:galectin-3b [Gasterosteus aculeatus aculeatus]